MQPTAARTVGAVAGLTSSPSGLARRRTILGVPVDALTRSEALSRVATMFDEPRFHHVVTVNPEFVMAAQRNEAFRTVLNRVDLALCDGAGIQWAASFLNGGRSAGTSLANFLFSPAFRRRVVPERVTGVDFLSDLFRFAADGARSVTLLHRADSLSNEGEIERTVKSRWPAVRLAVVSVPAGTVEPSPDLRAAVERTSPSILLSDLGAPEQDRLVASLGPRIQTVLLGLGVGGSFDFLTGAVRRAPRALRTLGLEWLWRLVLEPKRFGRIVTATVRFVRTVRLSRTTL